MAEMDNRWREEFDKRENDLLMRDRVAKLCKTLVVHHDCLYRFAWAHEAVEILKALGLPVPLNECNCFDDEWPWDDPGGPYDDAGPKEMVEFEMNGARLRVTPTELTGISTGRTRYKTECLTCEEELHQATTGPQGRCESHLQKKHGRKRG